MNMKKALPYVLLTALLFATAEPVSGSISGEVHFLTITFVRFLIGGLILAPFGIAAARRSALRLGRREILIMAGLGAFCVCLVMPMYQCAVQVAVGSGLSAAIIGILFSANSVSTLLLSALALGTPLTRRRLLGTFLCIGGILVCSLTVTVVRDPWAAALAIALAVAAALTFSLYTVLTRKYTVGIPGMVQLSISYCAGGVLLGIGTAVYGALSDAPVFAGIFAPTNLLTLLFLGIFVTGLGYWAYFRGIDHATALAASLVFFIKPILNPFVDFVYNQNPSALNWRVLLALALVVAGSVVATTTARPHTKEPR